MKPQKIRGYGNAKPSVSFKDSFKVLGLCLACVAVIGATVYLSGMNRQKGKEKTQISSTRYEDSENIKETADYENDDTAEISDAAPVQSEEPKPAAAEVTSNEKTDVVAVNEDDIYGTEPVVSADAKAVKLSAPLKGKLLKGQSNTELVYSKTLDDWRLHSGIDIGAKMGATVCASADGVVEDARKDIRFGYTIVISHGDNLKTVYCNLTGTDMVKVGMDVTKGDPIGMVGDSAICETSDEAHLHFEVILNGEYVNPLDYFSI